MKKYNIITGWLHTSALSFWSFGLCLLVTLFVASGCKTTKTTTKTEIHTEVETDSTSVAVQYDSTGVDMSKQLTGIDKLISSAQVEIDEIIETITTAATDSTPATTTTKTTRHIKAVKEQSQESEANASQTMHKTEVSSDSLAVNSHSKEKKQQKSKEKVIEKSNSTMSKWDMRLFCIIAILIFGYLLYRKIYR